jgi:hypothetical protein
MTIEKTDLENMYHHLVALLRKHKKGVVASRDKENKELEESLEFLKNEVVKLYEKLGSKPPESMYDGCITSSRSYASGYYDLMNFCANTAAHFL